MNSGRVFFGILGSLATGVMLGLLFAPEKGSHTIKKINEKEDLFLEELNQEFDQFLKSIDKKINHMAK